MSKQIIEETLAVQEINTLLNTKMKKANERKRLKNLIFFGMKLIALALALKGLFAFVVGIGIVQGASMDPGLQEGDVAFYFRLVNNYQVGDIVVCEVEEDKFWVKRVAAVAGDEISIDENGSFFRNGVVSEIEVYEDTYGRENGITYPYTVPEGSVFLLGDHRSVSFDSRSCGALPLKSLKGKVISLFRVWF